ncbi:MAG TPA: hypothetical protein VNI61_09205, partial [Gemmatimonadales bacterium]|nr:hypothetical protein [Gemmatimonadales bacterium]
MRGSTEAAVLAIALLAAPPLPRLVGQGVLREFSYDNLRPSAIQADLGLVGASRLTGAVTGGVRLDYGQIAPRVRVLLGLSYYRARFAREELDRFERRIRELVEDPDSNFTVDVGAIRWADLTGDLDLQYVFPQGRSVTTYLGLGLSVHLRNGSGAAIDGTFLEDALDDVAAGINATLGAEFSLGTSWQVTLDARGVLLSDHSTASLRGGLMYRWRESGSGGG